MFPRLQYITDSPQLAEQACKAGVRWVQARIKDRDEQTWIEIARDIAKICKSCDAICIVNDNPEIALRVNADGVHLGKKDMAVQDAKSILKNRKMILGGSANTAEDVINLAKLKVDYMGLGPLRFTSTKKDLNAFLGTEGYRKIMEEITRSLLKIPPVYAIGGVTTADVRSLLSMGIYGVAVCSAISRAENINQTVKEFISILNEKELSYETQR